MFALVLVTVLHVFVNPVSSFSDGLQAFDQQEKDALLASHNDYRRQTVPIAGNMEMLVCFCVRLFKQCYVLQCQKYLLFSESVEILKHISRINKHGLPVVN